MMRRVAALLLAAVTSAGQAQVPPSTQDLEARAFDAPVTIEVVELTTRVETRDALTRALREIKEIEELTVDTALVGDALAARGVRALNGRPGETVEIDPRLFELLVRARDYCVWSQQGHGPLGGHLYGAWGADPLGPPPSVLIEHSKSADCSRLALDAENGSATVVVGSKIDLRGFRRGYAIDRAIHVLRENGADNGWVSIGRILRAVGPGLQGAGWPMAVSATAGDDPPPERVVLDGRAIALASGLDETLRVGDKELPPWLNQRNGRPVEGVLAVMASSALALDAEALAVTLFVLPSREGEYRIGLIQPRPAAKWFLGSGQGRPLTTDTGWAGLKKW